MNGALKLGQAGDRKSEGTWLYIVFRNNQYLTWSEAENEEFRSLMEIDPDAKLPQIKVRRFHDPARSAFARKALQKYRRVGNIPPEVEQKIVRESVAHAVLEDWDLIALKDGTVDKYTPELGIQAFKEDEDFYDAVVSAGLNEDHHRATSLKEDADVLGKA